MGDQMNSYQKCKKMPPLEEPAKKLHPETYGAESESSKAKGKRPEEREEQSTQSSGLDASTKRTAKEAGLRHAQQVEYHLQQYQEEMADQVKKDDGSVYPDTSDRADRVSRKRNLK